MSDIAVVATGIAQAPASRLFKLLSDSSSYPNWSPIGSYELKRAGSHTGEGEIRIFKTWPVVAIEEVTEVEPDVLVCYTLLSGFPLEDYRARTTLTETDDGATRVEWRARFKPRYPLTGWFWAAFMRWNLNRFVTGLVKAAEAH